MPDPDPASMMIGALLFAPLFLLLAVLFSLCDEAFSALGETRIRELEESGNARAARMRKLTEHTRAFSTRIFLNTVLCGAGVSLTLTACVVTPFHRQFCAVIGVKQTAFTFVLAAVGLLLFCVFLFGFLGYVLPRSLVHKRPESVALALVRPFAFFYKLLYFLYGLCRLFTWPLMKMAGMDPGENPDKVTEDDIIEMIEDVEEIGELEESQKDMLNNIFEFDDITAGEIMTPRTDMAAVAVTDTLTDAVALAIEEGYSRLPIYEEDIDHVIGILYIKDLLPYVGRPLPKSANIRTLLRETHFVPDTKKCDELFAEMSERHLQMAIVVDEYGGVAGLGTVEDLLESIVGNMQDEFDNEEEEITRLDEDSFAVDGTLSISELSELLSCEFPDGDYDTVAGFLLDLLGHIPSDDENPVIDYQDLTFTIQKMDERRIEQILVRRRPDVTVAEKISE